MNCVRLDFPKRLLLKKSICGFDNGTCHLDQARERFWWKVRWERVNPLLVWSLLVVRFPQYGKAIWLVFSSFLPLGHTAMFPILGKAMGLVLPVESEQCWYALLLGGILQMPNKGICVHYDQLTTAEVQMEGTWDSQWPFLKKCWRRFKSETSIWFDVVSGELLSCLSHHITWDFF